MSDEDSNPDHTPWTNERSVSSLDTSESDLSDIRKQMIKFALEHPIRDIRTYSGYKGDLMVEITASKLGTIDILKSYAESIGMETVIKEKHTMRVHEIYCITPDPQIYKLKEPT